MSTFADLRLAEPILRAVTAEGYTVPTPIQEKSIPVILEGKDLCGVAQTGTGKTAAFALPIIQLLGHHHTPGPRCLVLAPTRELAAQISESFRVYGKGGGLNRTVVFGGVGYRPQIEAIKRGVDILIATPGRLMDLMQQGACDLSHISIFVLDEADRMLDMGFIHDIRKIVTRIPAKRQTLFFSATMPRDIRQLADSILKNPVTVEVAPQATAAETVLQAVYFVERGQKPALLLQMLEKQPATDRVLIFTRTKHGADRVAEGLSRNGIPAEAIHGNKRQNARVKALEAFRKGKAPVLVATDVASRGIDIDQIELVVNYEVPNVPETYVHRIGRTGRAGASGKAISFCDHEERGHLRDIERLMRRQITVLKTPTIERKKEGAAPGARSHFEAQPHRPPAPLAVRKETEHATRGDKGGHGVRPAHAPAAPKHHPDHPPHAKPKHVEEGAPPAPKHGHHPASVKPKAQNGHIVRSSKSEWHKAAGTEPAYQSKPQYAPRRDSGGGGGGGHGGGGGGGHRPSKPHSPGAHKSGGQSYGGSNTSPAPSQHNQRDHSGQSGGSHGHRGARSGGPSTGGGHRGGGGGGAGGGGGGFGSKGRGKKGGKRFGSR